MQAVREQAEGSSADAELPAERAEATRTLKGICGELEKMLKAHSRPSGSVKTLDQIFDSLSDR